MSSAWGRPALRHPPASSDPEQGREPGLERAEPSLGRQAREAGRSHWVRRIRIESCWLGIYDGAGIHGTTDIASLGTAASHGCIRMSIPEVEELYEQVPVGTPVYTG